MHLKCLRFKVKKNNAFLTCLNIMLKMNTSSLRLLLIYCSVMGYHFQFCGASSWSLFNHMATKTPYFKHPLSPAHDAMPVDATNITEGYKAIHLDALYRHGTRYPGKVKLSIWSSLLRKLSSFDTSNSVNDILKSWSKLFPSRLNYSLHHLGWKELQFLARQSIKQSGALYSKIFHLHGKNKHEDFTFHVYSSPKRRTVSSADAFVTYLMCYYLEKNQDRRYCNKFSETKYGQEEFTDGIITYGGITMIMDRKRLRPFDACEKFLKRVKNNETASVEVQQFFKSSEFQDIKLSVSNYFNGNLITSKEVYSLYQLCSFLLVLHNNTVFCNYFNNQHIKIMEYASDLRHYYQTGYGYPINYQFSCELLHDVLVKIDRAKNAVLTGKAKPSVVLRFGHAETLIPLLCLLGLYKDELPLTADSFDIHRDRRLFRTGTFSPFAGHISFTLFQSIQGSSLKLAVVVSGQYIKLPTCGNCYLCDLNTVLNCLNRILARFNCSTVCRNAVKHDEL